MTSASPSQPMETLPAGHAKEFYCSMPLSPYRPIKQARTNARVGKNSLMPPYATLPRSANTLYLFFGELMHRRRVLSLTATSTSYSPRHIPLPYRHTTASSATNTSAAPMNTLPHTASQRLTGTAHQYRTYEKQISHLRQVMDAGAIFIFVTTQKSSIPIHIATGTAALVILQHIGTHARVGTNREII